MSRLQSSPDLSARPGGEWSTSPLRRSAGQPVPVRRRAARMDGVNPESIHYLILYRTPDRWRTSVGGPAGLACGGLPESPADAPFEVAEREFRRLLVDVWGFDRPVTWRQDKPDWWSADVRPR
ncbi:MAG TPA: hypothetical protein VGF17_26760 [Phytomonospora sp.]